VILFLIFQILIFSFIKAFLRLRFFLSMSLNFIIAWNNEKWYNKRDLIWRFTLVFMKSYAGNWQINRYSRNWQSVLKFKGLYRTGDHFTGLVRRYFVFTERYDLNFPIVNFPFICSNIPSAPAYGVYISQLIQYSRACGSYQDFHDRGLLLKRKLLNQGFLLD
jgi:hypothetical protein